MSNVRAQYPALNTELLQEAKRHGLPSFDELSLASQQLEKLFDDSEFRRWSEQSLRLLQYTLYATDISKAYFVCCARLISQAQHEVIFELIDTIYELHHRSPLLAVAFMKQLPSILEPTDNFSTAGWASIGLTMCSDNWKSIGLGQLFFTRLSTLQTHTDKDSIAQLANIMSAIAKHSTELAGNCLTQSVSAFQLLDRNLHRDFLQLGETIVQANWSQAWHYFEHGPGILAAYEGQQLHEITNLINEIVSLYRFDPYRVFEDIMEAVVQISPAEHADLHRQAMQLNRIHPLAALEFLRSAPRVRSLVPREAMDDWIESALRYQSSLKSGSAEEPGELLAAFFKIESASATQALAELSGRVDFEHTGNLLRLYGQALAGKEIRVQPARALVNRGLGWTSAQSTTTDGQTIYVPQFIDTFTDAGSNLQAYKVCVAHQAGRLVFGSFSFRYDMDGAYLPATQSARAAKCQGLAEDDPLRVIAMHRYLDLFDDRPLIHGIFSLVEDYRVNCQTRREYPGLVKWIDLVQADEIRVRPDPSGLPLRQALVDNLLHVSLGSIATTRWPTALRQLMEPALQALAVAAEEAATVQDSAEAAAFIYDIARQIPNVQVSGSTLIWEHVEACPFSTSLVLPDVDRLIAGLEIGSLEETAYENPLLANFHGEFKPELVQTLDLLRNSQDAEFLTAEQLQELLDQSEEVEGVTAESIEREIATDEPVELEAGTVSEETPDASEEEAEIEDLEQVLHWYSYDEWNYRANDYLKGWCQVGERNLKQGSEEFYDATLKKYTGLVAAVRRQFELMRPESQRILKNLDDGPQIDLDKATEFFIDKKAGVGPRARFYSRRDKIERSVAVAFLMDMSGSTQEPVRAADPALHPGTSNDPNELRIIDLEKASTVLIIEALEAIGDSYGIYGFSGYGRSNVSYHIIKEFDQQFDIKVKQRIDSIEPLKSTRMGAAIRHTSSKLAEWPAKVKILMLISDGRPQDQGYGEHHGDHDYAIHDTRQALTECKQQGIVPFLITVDKEGQDYLKDICKDMGYEIVSDVEALPQRLTTIYRHLATKS